MMNSLVIKKISSILCVLFHEFYWEIPIKILCFKLYIHSFIHSVILLEDPQQFPNQLRDIISPASRPHGPNLLNRIVSVWWNIGSTLRFSMYLELNHLFFVSLCEYGFRHVLVVQLRNICDSQHLHQIVQVLLNVPVAVWLYT